MPTPKDKQGSCHKFKNGATNNLQAEKN